MKQILTAIRIFFALTLITGLVYPLLVTVVGQALFRQKAKGGMIERGGKTIGAQLIAQKFTSAKYFWGRPSAIDYNPLPSGGSNLGPTSEALKKAVNDRAEIIRKAHEISADTPIPQDLLYASGSGLDPEISPEAARFQIKRIAKARGISDTQLLERLLESHISNPELGFIGEPKVNVLQLNLALDNVGVR